MEQLLSSPVFRYAIFPLGSAVLGVAVKWVSRNDKYAKFCKEDFAVGPQLMLTACLMFVGLTTDRSLALLKVSQQLAASLKIAPIDPAGATALQAEVQRLSNSLSLAGWTVALFFVGLWSVSTIVRKWGWKSETEMTRLVGIAIPLGMGVLALIAVMVGAAQ